MFFLFLQIKAANRMRWKIEFRYKQTKQCKDLEQKASTVGKQMRGRVYTILCFTLLSTHLILQDFGESTDDKDRKEICLGNIQQGQFGNPIGHLLYILVRTSNNIKICVVYMYVLSVVMAYMWVFIPIIVVTTV